MTFDTVKEILLPAVHWQKILDHCRRKLSQNYLEGESEGRKAYGIIAGSKRRDALITEKIVPLKKNVRDVDPYKSYMDSMMQEHAIPSKNPFSMRGWMTDPTELKTVYDLCDKEDLLVFGTYHMHIVPWENDPLRDSPTVLDTVLAKGSGLFTFILSMVDPSRPSIRAYYEGKGDREVSMVLLEDQKMAKTG